jgi:hypothetical protein
VRFDLALAIAGAALGVGQVVPYVRSILRGITKPSPVSIAIYLVGNIITVSALFAFGAAIAAVLPLAFMGSNILVLVLSRKFGINEISWRDLACVVVAAVAVIGWISVGPEVAVYLMALLQITATVACVMKLQRHPGTEDAVSWGMSGLAAFCAVLGIVLSGAALSPAVLIIPVVGLLESAAVTAMALRQGNAAPAQNRQVAGSASHPLTAPIGILR